MSWTIDYVGPNGYVSERMQLGEVDLQRFSIDDQVIAYSMTITRQITPKLSVIMLESFEGHDELESRVSAFARRFARAYAAAKEADDAA